MTDNPEVLSPSLGLDIDIIQRPIEMGIILKCKYVHLLQGGLRKVTHLLAEIQRQTVSFCVLR